MSKAEEFAIEKYPIFTEDVYGHKIDVNLWQRKACVDGYHQAEKDLALTWEDLAKLRLLFDSVESKIMKGKLSISVMTKEYCQEVLKRFENLRHVK